MSLNAALSALLIFSAACYALLGLRLILAKRDIGSMPIGMLFIVISFWVVGGAIELLSSTFLMFSVGRTGHFIGTAFVPVVAYFCFREYTGTDTSLGRIAALAVIPLISVSLAATNANHELMWSGPFVNAAGEFLTALDALGRATFYRKISRLTR